MQVVSVLSPSAGEVLEIAVDFPQTFCCISSISDTRVESKAKSILIVIKCMDVSEADYPVKQNPKSDHRNITSVLKRRTNLSDIL